jgi:hypothetical protein
MVKSRRMKWAGHVVHMREINAYKILVAKPEGKIPLENLGLDGSIISKRILGKYGLGAWIGFIWLRIRTGDGLL